MRQNPGARDRSPLLSWLMFPVGAGGGLFFSRSRRAGQRRAAQPDSAGARAGGRNRHAFGFLVSLIGSGAHWFSHATNPDLLLQLIAGGVAGAIGGTLLSTRVPRRPLRFALWVWLLILGGQFLFNSYQVWASPRSHSAGGAMVRSNSAPGSAMPRVN